MKEGKRIRRTLPEKGRLHIDRPLPFLCVYRRPTRRGDAGTERLVTTEPSYLIASGARRYNHQLAALVQGIAGRMVQEFGASLVLEIWAGEDDQIEDPQEAVPLSPRFRIVAPRGEQPDDFLDDFRSALSVVLLRSSKGTPGSNVAASKSRAPSEISTRNVCLTILDEFQLSTDLRLRPWVTQRPNRRSAALLCVQTHAKRISANHDPPRECVPQAADSNFGERDHPNG